MNILILSGSPRKGGNTELLAEAFAKGASAHHHVEIVSVRDYKVNPCLGCNACFEANGICVQKDDMAAIYEKVNQADMLVIASPVYFYGISAQLKAIIDRFHNPIRDSFHIQKMALLLVGAASLPELFDAILTSEDFERSKPDPDCYLKAANRLGASVKDSVVFEDSFNGLKSGRAAGMYVVGLATTNPAEAISPYADKVVKDYHELASDL